MIVQAQRLLKRCRRAILIVEYNAIFGPERSLTIPYDLALSRYEPGANVRCFSASLKALEKIASRKDHRLIGGDSAGVNAFLLDCSIEASGFPTVTPERCWRPMKCLTDLGPDEWRAPRVDCRPTIGRG